MNISDLFERIQDEFHPDEIKGEFALVDNEIIWSYNLDMDDNDYEMSDSDDMFSMKSSEEILIEAYDEDVEKINDFFDEIEEIDNWSISDNEIIENIISFKIF